MSFQPTFTVLLTIFQVRQGEKFCGMRSLFLKQCADFLSVSNFSFIGIDLATYSEFVLTGQRSFLAALEGFPSTTTWGRSTAHSCLPTFRAWEGSLRRRTKGISPPPSPCSTPSIWRTFSTATCDTLASASLLFFNNYPMNMRKLSKLICKLSDTPTYNINAVNRNLVRTCSLTR